MNFLTGPFKDQANKELYEKSRDNIGKVKKYETIDEACLSSSEKVFLLVDH